MLAMLTIACQNQDSLIGDSYFEQGDYLEAINAYDAYLELKPRHTKTIYNRGRCYQELGRYEEAVHDFEKVLDQDPKNVHALLSMGQEMYRQEAYNSTILYCEKAIAEDRSNAMAYYLSGRSLHKMGLVIDALENYSKAININPEFGEAYFHRSAINLYLDKKAAACRDLALAVRLKVPGAEDVKNDNCE
jgi:tetratricopeptide (TPR) repeat protein